MKLEWYLKEEDYCEYQKHQHEYEGDEGSGSGEYIGSVRMGELCYDILSWGNHLWFDLYVGGVDTGSGYSDKEDYKNYPYDYCEAGSFRCDDDLQELSQEQFERDLSEYIEEHICTIGGYITDTAAITVNLVEKAEEELKLW